MAKLGVHVVGRADEDELDFRIGEEGGQIIVSGKAFRARIVQLFRVDVVCRDHFQRVQLTGFVQVKVSHVTETDNSSFHPQNSSSY